jgi:hypothetical protein
MDKYIGRLASLAAAGCLTLSALHPRAIASAQTATASPCTTDSSYQRLDFWVGDWDVYDSTGATYATERVRPIIDACAITAEWTGRRGDKGMSLFAYDVRTGDWTQIYASNQVPSREGVYLRKSDRSYNGPGLRFIELFDPPAGNLSRSRVTTMSAGAERVLQLFESSSDGGKTWRTVFKGEFRRQQ